MPMRETARRTWSTRYTWSIHQYPYSRLNFGHSVGAVERVSKLQICWRGPAAVDDSELLLPLRANQWTQGSRVSVNPSGIGQDAAVNCGWGKFLAHRCLKTMDVMVHLLLIGRHRFVLTYDDYLYIQTDVGLWYRQVRFLRPCDCYPLWVIESNFKAAGPVCTAL